MEKVNIYLHIYPRKVSLFLRILRAKKRAAITQEKTSKFGLFDAAIFLLCFSLIEMLLLRVVCQHDTLVVISKCIRERTIGNEKRGAKSYESGHCRMLPWYRVYLQGSFV